MARKNVLSPQLIASAQSLATSFNSTPTMVTYTDNVAYQLNITTSNSVGTFSVQGSVDYQPRTEEAPGTSGNWVDLSLGGGTTMPVAAASESFLINMTMLPFNAIRVSYTSAVAGTGTVNIYIMNKTVGA